MYLHLLHLDEEDSRKQVHRVEKLSHFSESRPCIWTWGLISNWQFLATHWRSHTMAVRRGMKPCNTLVLYYWLHVKFTYLNAGRWLAGRLEAAMASRVSGSLRTTRSSLLNSLLNCDKGEKLYCLQYMLQKKHENTSKTKHYLCIHTKFVMY